MGFIEEDMGRDNLEKVGEVAGPRVHLYFFDPVHSIWDGAVVIACPMEILAQQSPMLTFSVDDGEPGECVGEIIHRHEEWCVIRYVVNTLNHVCTSVTATCCHGSPWMESARCALTTRGTGVSSSPHRR